VRLVHSWADQRWREGKSACATWTDAPNTEAAGLGYIEPRVPAVGVGLWRGGNWTLHAGIVLGSAYTYNRIETSCGRTFECQAGVSRHAACIAHSNAVLALCACLVLFVLRVCVIGSSVLPLVPLRSRKRIQQRPKRMLRAAAFIGACSLLQIAQKSRNSCGLNGRGCGCIGQLTQGASGRNRILEQYFVTSFLDRFVSNYWVLVKPDTGSSTGFKKYIE